MKTYFLPIIIICLALTSCTRLSKEKLSNRNDTLGYFSQVLNDSLSVKFKPNQVMGYEISFVRNAEGEKLIKESQYLSAESLKSARELHAVGKKSGFTSSEYEIKKIEFETIQQFIRMNKAQIESTNIFTSMIDNINIKFKADDNYYYSLNFNKDLELTFVYKTPTPF
jgi:hypothetical protein